MYVVEFCQFLYNFDEFLYKSVLQDAVRLFIHTRNLFSSVFMCYLCCSKADVVMHVGSLLVKLFSIYHHILCILASALIVFLHVFVL